MFNDLGVDIHRVTAVVCQAPSASYNDEVLALVEGLKGFGLQEEIKLTTTTCGRTPRSTRPSTRR